MTSRELRAWRRENLSVRDRWLLRLPWLLPRLDVPPSAEVVRRLGGPGEGVELGAPGPFVLLKPTGLAAGGLEAALGAEGVVGWSLGRFGGHGRASVRLYDLDLTEPGPWLWLAVLQALEPEAWDRVEVWRLDCAPDRLPALKRRLRKALRSVHRRAAWPGGPTRVVSLHAVHAPDPDRVEQEWSILEACLCDEALQRP